MKIRLYFSDGFRPVTLDLGYGRGVNYVHDLVVAGDTWLRNGNRLYNLSSVWMIEGLEDE